MKFKEAILKIKKGIKIMNLMAEDARNICGIWMEKLYNKIHQRGFVWPMGGG
jgi:hypothetical protein